MIIVLMGVSGCGKTTLGTKLSLQLSWTFYDADDFHSPQNKEKMSKGIPLTDDDRRPWLQSLAELIHSSDSIILACSALKRCYREKLRVKNDVNFVYLRGSYELIRDRMEERSGHYFSAQMLESQFEVLEEPSECEGIVVVDIDRTIESIVAEIRTLLRI